MRKIYKILLILLFFLACGKTQSPVGESSAINDDDINEVDPPYYEVSGLWGGSSFSLNYNQDSDYKCQLATYYNSSALEVRLGSTDSINDLFLVLVIYDYVSDELPTSYTIDYSLGTMKEIGGEVQFHWPGDDNYYETKVGESSVCNVDVAGETEMLHGGTEVRVSFNCDALHSGSLSKSLSASFKCVFTSYPTL